MMVAAIIQARAGSTRLPRKVLKQVAGRPVLSWVVDRVRRSAMLDDVIVATSTQPADDAVAALAAELGVACHRGSEEDVLARYHEAATRHGVDAAVRVTADCPLTDPVLIDEVVQSWLEDPLRYDFVANTLVRRYPRGLDVALVTTAALAVANERAVGTERVHVTPYVRDPQNGFRLRSVLGPLELGHWRWTLDEPADLAFVREVYRRLVPFPDYGWERVKRLIEEHPELQGINQTVHQKVEHEG